jgi:hypothetical protein
MRSCTCMCHVNSQGAAWTLFKVHALLGQLLVVLQHNDRVSMGSCDLGLGAVNSSVFLKCCSASSGASDTVFVQLRAASSGASFAWCLSLQLSWTIPIPCLAQSPLRLGIIHGPMIDRSLSWLSVRYFSAPALLSHRQNISTCKPELQAPCLACVQLEAF